MSYVEQAIQDCLNYPLAFSKFISANDAGATGAHQSGFYIPKHASAILFDTPGEKGENKDRTVKIRWQAEFETESRFVYYGQKTRNEYRITRFGRGFPYLRPEAVGDLLVLVQVESNYYHAYVIEGDEDMDAFFSALGISASETNRLIASRIGSRQVLPTLEELFRQYIVQMAVDFPETAIVSSKAREFFHAMQQKYLTDPDALLLGWLDTEYALFRAIEYDRYKERIATPFASVDELVECANTMLNRRKSRAGHSLENHLAEIFRLHRLPFDEQAKTEGNKKPDFLFPGGDAYHDATFPEGKLTFLAAKTTCKDRWRQILNEADRIPEKHLFTLQQGISENQLAEMYDSRVTLVVPRPYLSSFPAPFRSRILALDDFIRMVKAKLA